MASSPSAAPRDPRPNVQEGLARAPRPRPLRPGANRLSHLLRLVVAAMLAIVAVLAFTHPRQDFDLMAYVGLVHTYDAPTTEIARERTVVDLRRELDDERFAWITGRDYPGKFTHSMAYDTRSFGQQLSWFRGRPAFTRAAWLLSKAGLPVPRALHVVTLLSTLLLAWIFYVGTHPPQQWARPESAFVLLFRLAAWVGIAALFHLGELAASPLSDPSGAAFVLGGLLLVFDGKSPRAGLVVLVVAVLARSDNAIYVAALALFATMCALQKKPAPVRAAEASFSALAAFALRAWVERGSYGWAALVHFRRVHFEIYPADVRHRLDLATYLGIVKTWALEVYACEVVALVALVVLLALPRGRATLASPFVSFAVWMVPLSIARFLAFPDWDSRFFVAPLGFFFLGMTRAFFLAWRPREADREDATA